MLRHPLMSSDILHGELIYHCQELSSKFKEVIVVPVSDIHYGNPMFSKHHLQKTIDFILSKPNIYTILNGDLCECVLRTSKGDVYTQTATPQKQRDYIVKAFMPIKDRVLGMTSGNHEGRIFELTGVDICSDIAEKLGCPYSPEEILVKVSFGAGNARMKDGPYCYYIYATHGYGGARTKGAKNVKVERTSHQVYAHCYIMSHDHDASIQEGAFLTPHPRTYIDKATGFKVGSMTSIDKKLVKTGAYLKRGGYAARGGYDPVSLNIIEIKLKGEGKPRIRVEM
jgi:hypothetical protein